MEQLWYSAQRVKNDESHGPAAKHLLPSTSISVVYPADCYFGVPALATFTIIVPRPPRGSRYKWPDYYVRVAMQLWLLSYQRVNVLLGVPGPLVNCLRSSAATIDVGYPGAGALQLSYQCGLCRTGR